MAVWVRRALLGGRAALGLVVVVAPRRTLALLGVDPTGQPALGPVARFFAVRDLLMVYQLARARGDDVDATIRQHMVVDAADAATAALAGLRGDVPVRVAAGGVLAGLGGAAAGVLAQEGGRGGQVRRGRT